MRRRVRGGRGRMKKIYNDLFIGSDADRKILIHCNMGQSRSSSIGLIYLAIIGIITNNSFETAMEEFRKLYPEYLPGTGIMLYMQHNWDFLMNLRN